MSDLKEYKFPKPITQKVFDASSSSTVIILISIDNLKKNKHLN